MALRITGRHAVVLDALVSPLHREVVCEYLECQPGDLLRYQRDAESPPETPATLRA